MSDEMCNEVMGLGVFLAAMGFCLFCVAVIALACNAETLVKAVKEWRKE